ncbi:prostaglandin E synthase isoform X1 [Aphelocoma coerulescens]|uniref:prostaglandin E synthase isoform X1 n=2 Tax=Aphelocoma coerulescens TaxID=39617 RepID=UPI0036051CE2
MWLVSRALSSQGSRPPRWLVNQGKCLQPRDRVLGIRAATPSSVHGVQEFSSTILILKMYVVAIITGQVRLRKKAFANPEDALRNGGVQFCREDPDVERCRRAHRNDMENIFPFLFLGAIYSLLDPSPAVARIHFLIFCVGRIIHTIAYLLRLRAPTRSVAYSVAQLPCFSMALQILLATTPYW